MEFASKNYSSMATSILLTTLQGDKVVAHGMSEGTPFFTFGALMKGRWQISK